MTRVLLPTICLVLATGACAERWQPPDGRFPILGWVIPSAEGFEDYADAGFTVLWACREADLEAAEAAGLNSLVSGFIRETEEESQQFVRETMGRPGVIGYSMRDEPGADDFAKYAQYRAWGEEVWPEALYQINLFPNYANAEQMDVPTYREYVARFMEVYDPKVLSFDHYPLVGEDDLRPQYYENLEIIREAALEHDVPFWAFALVTPHWSYRDPTEAEIRFQVFSDIVYGAQGIWYFCYKQPSPEFFLGGVVDRQERPTHQYPRVQRINAILQAWGPTLLRLRSTGVYHVGEPPEGTVGLPADSLVRSVSPAEQMIVGEFQHADGRHYVMLMNKDWHRARQYRMGLAPEVTALREVSRRDGQFHRPLQAAGGQVKLRVMAGGARLFRVER
ncbi:MAG: hypothetical protein ACP5KN_03735 [Armatimonadota bacterium]